MIIAEPGLFLRLTLEGLSRLDGIRQTVRKTKLKKINLEIYPIFSWTVPPLHSKSAGAQSTQRPLPFPLAARSTMLGWEHVTACTAVILWGYQSFICESKREHTL